MTSPFRSPAQLSMTGTLTEADIAQLRTTFDDFDKDHNGILDQGELAGVLTVFLTRKPSGRQLARIFKAADIDKDGKIDFNEFVTAINKVRLDQHAERKAVFDSLDTNHNGVIDAGEFCSACAQLGLTLSRPEVEVLLENYDKNGDHVVDFREFAALIASLD